MQQIYKLIFIIIVLTSFSSNASTSYPIEKVIEDDEVFIINGEKYSAQTDCFNWEEDDDIIFIEGSEGACSSAKLYNKNKNSVCNVWCE